METVATSELNILAGSVVLGFVIAVAFFLLKIVRAKGTELEAPKDDLIAKNGKIKTKKQTNESAHNQKSKALKKVSKKSGKHAFTHPWLACTLKGHNGEIIAMDFSANGKYLATCSDDRSVLLWGLKDFTGSDHRCIRGNVEFDHATKIKFSPDNKALIVSLGLENTLRVLRIGKKEDGSAGNITGVFDFPVKHSAEIINIGVASTGHYIMTCYADTLLKVWSIKGELLHTIDSKQMHNSYGAVTPCGRFIASSGFTPDVKAWHVKFDRGGNFQEVKRAWELKGHSAKIHHFAFSNDSTRAATVSSDSTWRVWDIDVEFERGGDPRLLNQGNHSFQEPCRIALSHNFRSLTLSCGSSLVMYDALSGAAEHMQDVHAGTISALGYSNTSKFFVSVGDRQIQVFHNVVAFRATIVELEEKLVRESRSGNKAVRERLTSQLAEARQTLAAVEA